MINPIHAVRAAVGFTRVVRDPDRLGEVFQFVDHYEAAFPHLTAPVVDAFRQTLNGARALAERPRIGRISLNELATLPPGSLGHAFATHMRENGLDPAALPTRKTSTDSEYVSAHLYETHDVWHVVTGFAGDRAGELGLQAFYLAQFPSRIAAGILTIGFANLLLFEFDDRNARMEAIVRGWLLGRRAQSILGVDWKQLWSTPLSEVRAQFGIDIDTGSADGVLALPASKRDQPRGAATATAS